ncbi:MAG: hypothetical protein NTY15_10745 [Planctomycetota bacterium]|nr:hypothetical protein [Planctomycetota bacterium]
MSQVHAILKFIPVVLFSLTASFAAAQSSASDPSGTWRWSYEFEGKTQEDSLSLNLDEGKVTGTFQGILGKPTVVKDAKLKDNQVSCVVEYKYKDQTVSLEFVGKVKKDDLEGTVVVTTEEYPWTPKRSVKLDDAVGQWNIVIDADGNKLEPSIIITKSGDALQGKYTVAEGTVVDVTDLKIRDNKLEFRVDATVQGRKIRADYSGRPYGHNLKGNIKYDLDGNEGEIDFTAKRQPAKK